MNASTSSPAGRTDDLHSHETPAYIKTVRRNWQEQLVYRLNGRFPGLASRALAILGVDFPRTVHVGTGLQLPHGANGLVLHGSTVIGDNVTLFHGVTVGRGNVHVPISELPPGGGVTIGDGAIIGAHAVTMFNGGQDITIGSGAVIGAAALVTTSIPAAEIWAGSPARCVGRNAYAPALKPQA